jgi:hypothetical protein
VVVRFPPASVGALGLGPLRKEFIGIDTINTFANDGQSAQLPRDSNTRGTMNTQLFVNALKEACSAPFTPPSDAGPPTGTPDDHVLSTTPPDLDVIIGDPPNATSTRYSIDATNNGTYTSMTVEASIKTRRGTVGCPIASGGTQDQGQSDGPDAEILTLSRPMTEIEYRFEAERSSVPPVIPNPLINDGNLALISDELTPMAVGLAPDGQTIVYRIGGIYKYVCRYARKAADAINFGVHPWTDFSYDDALTQFPAANFIHGIVDSIAGNPTLPGTPGDDGGQEPVGPDGPIGPSQ